MFLFQFSQCSRGSVLNDRQQNCYSCYRYLLKIIALPLLNKNSSELLLPLFATATFGELLKFVLFCRSKVCFAVSP